MATKKKTGFDFKTAKTVMVPDFRPRVVIGDEVVEFPSNALSLIESLADSNLWYGRDGVEIHDKKVSKDWERRGWIEKEEHSSRYFPTKWLMKNWEGLFSALWASAEMAHKKYKKKTTKV